MVFMFDLGNGKMTIFISKTDGKPSDQWNGLRVTASPEIMFFTCAYHQNSWGAHDEQPV